MGVLPLDRGLQLLQTRLNAALQSIVGDGLQGLKAVRGRGVVIRGVVISGASRCYRDITGWSCRTACYGRRRAVQSNDQPPPR